MPVVDPGHTDAVAARHLGADRLFLQSRDAPALALESEARVVLLTRIRIEAGQLELWLRAYDRKGEVLAVGHGSGRLATLGEALVAAFAPVRTALGAGSGGGETPPRLGELGLYERALERIAGGSLSGAWQELAGIQSPTADALRGDIVALSGAAGVAAAERSRLASARGTGDPDWLAIRHDLQQERSVNALLAGAEHAKAGGEADRALVLYAEAAQADAGNLEAERGRARMLGALERHDDAKTAFERVLSLAPDDVEARLALAKNPTLAPAEQARFFVSAGEEQSRRLDDEGARFSFERAAQLDADVRAATRRHFARLEETLGNDVEAMAAWDEAYAADPNDLEALGGLGRTRARNGDPTGAAVAFEQLVALEGEDAQALHGLGDALLAQGKTEEAVAALQQAVAHAPGDAAKRGSLARALVASGKPEAALQVLDPEQVALEDRPLVLTQAAEIHAGQGRLGEAQSALVEAVALEPDEPPLRSALAKVRAEAGDAEGARAEEAVVAKLTGASLTPKSAPKAGAGSPAEPQGPNEFSTLVEGFPEAGPEGSPVSRVVWLGLVTPRDWQSLLRAWLLPQTIEPSLVETALQYAVGARFELVPGKPPTEQAAPALANLRALGTDRPDVALRERSARGGRLVRRAPGAEPRDGPLRSAGRPAQGRAPHARRPSRGRGVASRATPRRSRTPRRTSRWNWRAGVALAVLVLLVVAPLLRGWGTLDVVLEYERARGSQGFFSIELSRRPGRVKAQRKRDRREQAHEVPAPRACVVALRAPHGRIARRA